MNSLARPFILAAILGPLIIVLHEFGHLTAAAWLGLRPHLHFASVTKDVTPTSTAVAVIVAGCGPLVEAALTAAGLVALWYLRRARRNDPASWLDWVATAGATCASRWLPIPGFWPRGDEALLSRAAELPEWTWSALLVPFAIAAMVAVVRLHAPGARLWPFTAAVVGGALGIGTWTTLVGPRLLA